MDSREGHASLLILDVHQKESRPGVDAYELERRLGHRSQRYIERYTNPPEAVAANYVEEF